MSKNDFVVTLVCLGVLNNAHERRETGTGAHEIEIAARQQMIDDERASRFTADEKLIAHLNILQTRGQWAVLNLNTEEFEFLIVVRASDAVGAHKRLAIDVHANHDEMAVLKFESRVACGLKAEKRVVPMVDGGNALRGDGGQLSSSCKGF